MSRTINESPAERHQDNREIESSATNSRYPLFPASREAWVDVLATATRYY